jgi:ketosteroid isomerase-like protein
MSEASYHGHEGFPRFLRDLSAVWGTYRQEPRELIDLGDRMLVLGELTGRALASGVPLAQRHASLYHLADGKLIRQEEYLDPDEALEVVGLSE